MYAGADPENPLHCVLNYIGVFPYSGEWAPSSKETVYSVCTFVVYLFVMISGTVRFSRCELYKLHDEGVLRIIFFVRHTF